LPWFPLPTTPHSVTHNPLRLSSWVVQLRESGHSSAPSNGITRENVRSWLYEGTHVSANSSKLKQGMTSDEAQDTLQWWYLKLVSESTYGDLKIGVYRTDVNESGVPDVWLTFHNGQLHAWSIIANP